MQSYHSHRLTWPLLTAPLLWLFVYSGVWISGRLAGLFGYHAAMNGRWQDNIVALFASVPVFLCLWLWLRLYERRPVADIGLDRPLWRGFGAGFLRGVLLVVAVVGVGLLLGGYSLTGAGAWSGFDLVWLTAAVLALAGTIVQATVTEALWRGWMLSSVASQWGPMAALVFNMVATLVIQGGNALRSPEMLIGAINMTLMAGLLSLTILRGGTLWRVCGFHAGWNLTMGFGLGLPIDGGKLAVTPLMVYVAPNWDAPVWLHGGGFGPDGSVLMTVAILIAILWRRGAKRPIMARRAREDDYDAVDDH